MDRARRAEPYSSAATWTREVARNLAGHLARVSNAHSCVDTSSPKSTQLPKFQHARNAKKCVTSPMKTRQVPGDPLPTATEPAGGYRSFSGRQEEERADNQSEPSDGKLARQREDLHAEHQQHKSRHHTAKTPAESALLPERDHHDVVQEGRRALDKVRIPAKERVQLGDSHGESTYDCPPMTSSGKLRPGMDYKQKQAQLKIWQENQALAKRLRSTKPTLKSKDWERDDKWNQEFLKSQERRRSLLQTELGKAQTVPRTTIVRVRPLKLPHHEPLGIVAEPDVTADCDSALVRCKTSGIDGTGLGSLSARDALRRRSRSRTLGADPMSDAETRHIRSSAANHRRIMHLRHQRGLHPPENEGLDQPDGTTSSDKDAFNGTAVDLNDDELVNVRFTFSRQRSRGACQRRQEEDGSDSIDNSNGDGIPRAADASNEQGEKELGATSSVIELEKTLECLNSGDPPPTQDVEYSPRPSEIAPLRSLLDADQDVHANDVKLPADLPLSTTNLESNASEADIIGVSQTHSADMLEGLLPSPDINSAKLANGEASDTDSIPSQLECQGDPLSDRVPDAVSKVAGDQDQSGVAQDQPRDCSADEQPLVNEVLQAEALSANEREVDFSQPISDELESPSVSDQLDDGTSTVDTPPADAEPEYRDDVFDEDYQAEEKNESPPASSPATADQSELDVGDNDAYGSEYEDDGEYGDNVLDPQIDVACSGDGARGEQEDGDLEFEYSDDGFAED